MDVLMRHLSWSQERGEQSQAKTWWNEQATKEGAYYIFPRVSAVLSPGLPARDPSLRHGKKKVFCFRDWGITLGHVQPSGCIAQMSVPVHLVQVVRSEFKLKRYCCPYSWLVPESFTVLKATGAWPHQKYNAGLEKEMQWGKRSKIS